MNDGFSRMISVFSGGIKITVKAKPNCRKRSAPKITDIGDGKTALEVCVAEAAEGGKANLAVIEAVADLAGVPKSRVSIASGETSRLKIIEIEGDAETLRGKIVKLR